MAEVLTLDEATHTYTLDGKEVPGVTSVLSSVMRWDVLPPDQTEFYRQRGRAVHKACEIIDRGFALRPGSVDPVIEPYIEGYISFLATWKPHWELIEHPVHHPLHGYAGTLDRFGKLRPMGDRNYLIDLKSGAPHPAYWLQLAAYKEALWHANPIAFTAELVIVELTDNGGYKWHDFPQEMGSHRQCVAVFLGLLALNNWKKRWKV